MLIILRYLKIQISQINNQTNMAIKQAFDNLKKKILLDEDIIKLSNLEFPLINDLVSYYQVESERDNEKKRIKKFIIFLLIKRKYMIFFIKWEFLTQKF